VSERQRYVSSRIGGSPCRARRGCDAVNPDYLSFGARDKSWCLHHIPLLVRLKMRMVAP
jgi:hypothetical protein